jgi:hypothetical protein
MGGLTFRPELAEAVMLGKKTETRRRLSNNPSSPWWREKCGLKMGRHYAVQPGRGKKQIGRALIVHVSTGLLGHVDNLAARREGCAGRREFVALWEDLHGAFDPEEVVWVVWLERYLRYLVMESPVGHSGLNRHPAADLDEVRAVLEACGETRCWIIDNWSGQRVALEDVP